METLIEQIDAKQRYLYYNYYTHRVKITLTVPQRRHAVAQVRFSLMVLPYISGVSEDIRQVCMKLVQPQGDLQI